MSDVKEMEKSVTGALRDNKGKAPVFMSPLELDEAVSMVLYKSSIPGGGKYPMHNWEKGAPYSVPLSSLIRHAKRMAKGEMIDSESGLPHSWHIACNAAFLVYYEKHYPELNDLLRVAQAQPPVPEQVKSGGADAPPANPLITMLGAVLQAQIEGQKK